MWMHLNIELLKATTDESYPQLVFCVPKMRNISEIVYVENLDSSELVEEHMSIKGLFIWNPLSETAR